MLVHIAKVIKIVLDFFFNSSDSDEKIRTIIKL